MSPIGPKRQIPRCNQMSPLGAIAEMPLRRARLSWGCDDPTARLTTSASVQPSYSVTVLARLTS